MENSPKEQEYEKIPNQIKELLLIYDLVMTSAKNINEFNTSDIMLTDNIKKEDFRNFVRSYKNSTFQKPTNLNNISISFINLISNILSHYYTPKVSHIQLLMAYNLVFMFHKDNNMEKTREYKKKFQILLINGIKNYIDYLEILKKIKLIEEEEEGENNINIQYQNKCQIIKNLNVLELNSSISAFLLTNDKIPQYKEIVFPRLDTNDDEIAINNKIKEIAILLEVINSSLNMKTENIRFQLFNKYINQKEKLKAINKVLFSLNKNQLISLDENDLIMKCELYKENCSFLKKENNKNNMVIGKLMKKNDQYENEIKTLNQTVNELSQNLKINKRELSETKIENENLNVALTKQEKKFEEINEELKNIKYRDVCNYIIDYFVCILNDNDYEVAMKSEYKDAVEIIVKEMDDVKYSTYKKFLFKENINIKNLFDVLLKHKKKYNAITHGSDKEEEEFIRLIKNYESDEIGEKFRFLFTKTPLLKKYCFDKRNHITRFEIKNAMVNF